MCLFLCKYPSSYEYGFVQPMNQAVLRTLQKSILNRNKHIVEIHQNKRKNYVFNPERHCKLRCLFLSYSSI